MNGRFENFNILHSTIHVTLIMTIMLIIGTTFCCIYEIVVSTTYFPAL